MIWHDGCCEFLPGFPCHRADRRRRVGRCRRPAGVFRRGRPGGIPDSGLLDSGFEQPVANLPPVLLPADAAPADVDRVRFSLGLRGYRMDQVDQVLDELRDQLAAKDEEVEQLTARLLESQRIRAATDPADGRSRFDRQRQTRGDRRRPGLDTDTGAGRPRSSLSGLRMRAETQCGAGRGGSRLSPSTWRPGWPAPASSWPPPCTRAPTRGSRPSPTTGTSSISGMRGGTAKSSPTAIPSALPVDAAGNVQENAWAFYPLFPVLGRALVRR